MKKYILVFGAAIMFLPFLAKAQETIPSIPLSETITTEDLGIVNVGVLPTSRFYFLKEWTRNIERVLTFDATNKAGLELRIVNEKAAELKKVSETASGEAIEKSIQNYQENAERLKERLDALKETSENPRVDELLNKLADRTVKHEKLFDELEKKFEENAGLQKLTDDVKNTLENTSSTAAGKDEPAKFAARLEKAFTESKGGELKHLQSVEIIDRLSDKAPEKIKKELENLRQDFTERFKKDFEEFAKKTDEKSLNETIKDLPGDAARKSVIIEEIKRGAGKEALGALEKVGKILENSLEERVGGSGVPVFPKEEVLEQIKRAGEKIAELNQKIAEAKEIPDSVKKSLSEAGMHLKNAKAAYESGKFGDAFGQARSAEVLSRNGLRMLDNADENMDNFKEALREFEAKIGKYALWLREHKMTREDSPKAFELLDNAKQHLGFAYDALSKEDIAAVKMHIGHVRGFLSDLARIIEAFIRETTLPTTGQVSLGCTKEYSPVCGTDGKIYSNACFAKVAGVEVNYRGECKPEITPEPQPTVNITPIAAEISNATVVINESGNFNPQEVKIKKGGKVTWVNKSQSQVWPASNPHPTHTDYPGFDALKNLGMGESYSFKFDRVGSWKYHDHLSPSVTGAIVVEE